MTAPSIERTQERQHRSRLTERDADYLRLRDDTARRLSASLQRLVRELQSSHPADQPTLLSGFIQRQTTILQDAYIASVREGAKDYYDETSANPAYWAQRVTVNPDRMQAALAFYAPSIAKMAHEATVAVNAAPGVKLDELLAEAEETIQLFGGFHIGSFERAGRGPHDTSAFNAKHDRWGDGRFRDMLNHATHASHHEAVEERGGGAGGGSRRAARSPNTEVKRAGASKEPTRTALVKKWNLQVEQHKTGLVKDPQREAVFNAAAKLELAARRGLRPGNHEYDTLVGHFNAAKAELKAATKSTKAPSAKAKAKTPPKPIIPREQAAYLKARRQYQAATKQIITSRRQLWNTQRTLYRLEARKNLTPEQHERVATLRAKEREIENRAFQHERAQEQARTTLFNARRVHLNKQLGYKITVDSDERALRRLYTLFGSPRAAHEAIRDIVRPGKDDDVYVGLGNTTKGVYIHMDGATHKISLEVSRLSAAASARRGVKKNALYVDDPDVASHGKTATSGHTLVEALAGMRNHGVVLIKTGAMRSAQHNGYDTWAKLGARGVVPKSVRAAARARFGKGVHRVEQIMDLPGGPRWWREHGDTFEARMELFKGGRTAAKLDHLLARAQRSEALGELPDYGILLAEMWGDE